MNKDDVLTQARCTNSQFDHWTKEHLMPGARRAHQRKRGASWLWERRHVEYASIISTVTQAGGTLEDAAFMLFLHDLPSPDPKWVCRALAAHVERMAALCGVREGQSRTVEAVTARAQRAGVNPGLARLVADVPHTRGEVNESKLPSLAPLLSAETVAAAAPAFLARAIEDARRMLASKRQDAYRALRGYMEAHRPAWYDHPYDDADMVATLLADWPYRNNVGWERALLPLFTMAALARRSGLVAPDKLRYAFSFMGIAGSAGASRNP